MQEQPLPFTQVLAEEYKAIRGIDLPAGNPQEVLQQTGQVQPPLSALCISGGGIRSATFALGAIQAMAREGILDGFDYLSTVSGGGFIGSWLTAWIHRAGGLGSIGPQLSGSAPPSGPEAIDPVRHLREYNNYLTPSLGIFSADTWTLVATVARNILLNWLVIVPLLMATLMLPRVLFSVITLGQLYFDTYGNADAIAMSLPVVYGLPVAGMAMITVAIMNIGRHLPSLGAKNASQGRFLLGILAPLAAAAMIYIAHEQLFFWGANDTPTSRVSVALGLVFSPFLAGWLFFIAIHRSSFREKLKILFGPLTVAVLCMGISTGLMGHKQHRCRQHIVGAICRGGRASAAALV